MFEAFHNCKKNCKKKKKYKKKTLKQKTKNTIQPATILSYITVVRHTRDTNGCPKCKYLLKA